MKAAKRFLALLLVLAMTLSNLPMAVLADELTQPVPEETIVEETTPAPPEEGTETPPEEEITVPSEQPTEAPTEETEAPAVEPTEVPTEETETVVEETVSSEAAVSAQTDETVEPELVFHWLSTDENNLWYEPEDSGEQGNVDQLHFDPYYVIFYIKEWNYDTESWDCTPLKPSDLSFDQTLLSITTLPSDQCSGGNAGYYAVIDPYDDKWDIESEITYTLEDGTSASMPVWVGRSPGEFYSSSDFTNDTVIIHYTIDPDAQENAVYYCFENDAGWELSSLEIDETYAGRYSVTDLSVAGRTVKKFTLTDDAVQNAAGNGWWSIHLTPTVHSLTDDHYEQWPTTLWIYPPEDNATHESYLTFGWLNNDGEGWYEPADPNEKVLDIFRIMPGQEMYQIYYLNWWDASIGAYSQTPVHVQSEGELTFEKIGQDAAPGQENAEFFYRITTSTWDQDLDVVCTLQEGGTAGGVTALTDRNELSFYRSRSMRNDTCITDSFTVDLTEGAENELYVGFDSNYWSPSGDFRVEDFCQQWIRLEDTDDANMKRVCLTEDAMEMLRQGESLWVGACVDATGEENETMTSSCSFCLKPDLSSTQPYLTFGWLGNWGEGWFETEDHNSDGMAIAPGDTFYQIYYLNYWDDNQGCMVQTPVRVQGGDHITVGSVSEIAEGQQNSAYFCTVSTDAWDQNVEVYCTMDDGTRVSLEFWSGRGELGFYTAPEMTNENWLSGPVEIDPFGENSVYLGLNKENFSIQNVTVADDSVADYVAIEKISDTVYKLTQTEAGLNQNMSQYLLGIPLTVEIVNDQDENLVESWGTNIDFSRMELQSKAWITLDGEFYELFSKGDQVRWNHGWATGEQDENGNNIWENELVDSLPTGLTYDLTTNTLTMDNYHGQSIDIWYHSYDENQDLHFYNLPNGSLTIALIGENSLISNAGQAVNFGGDLNVTFTGDGSLHIQSTNSPDNQDQEGYPFHYPAMWVDGGSVTFEDSVNVTVEIAGEGLEACWDESGYLGSRTACMVALNTNRTDLYLKDSATLTTLVPEGAKSNGPILDEPDFFGDNTPGGHCGINGFASLTVSGGTLNTSDLKVDWGWDENGNLVSSSYTQTGGTVNIEALGYNSLADKWEWNEQTQQDEVTGTVEHFHYAGLEVLRGGAANISGGTLNIDVTPTEEEMASSSYFVGVCTRGGSLNISGGELNFVTAGGGCALEINTDDYEEDQPMASAFRLTGGTVNVHGDERCIIDAIYLGDGSTANLTGGTIDASWSSFNMHGDVTIDGVTLKGNAVRAEFGNLTMNSGSITMTKVTEEETENIDFNQIVLQGMCTMSGGTIDICDGMLVVVTALEHSGGQIRITNDREGPSWTSFLVENYYAISGDASLTISHYMQPCAVAVAGTFHQMGGTVDITHSSEIDEAAVHVCTGMDDQGNERHGSLLLNDGVFNIRTFKDCHNTGVRVDEQSVFFSGAQEAGQAPILNLTNVDMELNGTSNILWNAVIHVKEGTVRMGEHAVFTMDENAVFTVKTTQSLEGREEEAWYFAFDSALGSHIYMKGGTLTVNAHNYDVALHPGGDYTQTGGTVNATCTTGNTSQMNTGGAFDSNGTVRIEGGTMNLESWDTAFAYNPEEGSSRKLTISDGIFNLKADYGGIWLNGDTSISGGDFNIIVNGYEADVLDENGESLGKGLYALGIYVRDADLTITGGDFDIQTPVNSDGYQSFISRGITGNTAPICVLGGTFRIDSQIGIVLMNENTKPSFTLGNALAIYSTETGAKLELVTTQETDGWYFSMPKEENGDYAGRIEIGAKKAVIEVTADKTTLLPAEKATLKVLLTDCDDPDVKVTWTLDEGDGDYVTLKDNSSGTATITAKKNKEMREVTVTASAVGMEPVSVTLTVLPIVTKVNILNGDGEVITGTTQTLYMSTVGNNTMSLYAENDPDGSAQTWTWKSSNTKYATVDEEGVVTALTAGKTVTITATAADGSRKYATVKIKTVQPMEDIILAESAVLASGKSITLKAEVYPSNTTNKKLVWEIIRGTDYASISSSGKLSAKKVEGEQDITVRVSAAEDPTMFAECAVTIYPAVTAVKLYSEDVTDIEGPLNSKTVTLYMSSDPEDTCNTLDLDAVNEPVGSAQKVTWKSSNTNYATVDEEGIVTALTAGKTVTITATAADGTGKYATVKVKTVQPMEDVTLPETAVAAAGKTISLKAEISPANTTNTKLVWEIISGADYASITTSGSLKVAKTLDEMQTVTVRVSAAENEDIYDECVVTLYPTAVNKVDIQDGEGNSLTGKTLSLTMDTRSSNTVDLYTQSFAKDLTAEVAQEVTWKSSNTKYAAVDENGQVTVLVPGKTVTITATAADGSAKYATVKITGVQPMEDLTLKENLVLDAFSNPIIAGGRNLKLTTAVDIYPTTTSNQKLTWSVEDNDYGITVNASTGVLNTQKVTDCVTVEVTAEAQDGSGVNLTFGVSVYPATTKVTISNGGNDVTGKTLTLPEGATAVLEGVCTPDNAADMYTWKSSNNSYATVNEDGEVTGLTVGKTVTITCTAADGSGKYATVKIKVVAAE